RTGRYRTTAADAASRVSYADFAVALLDEIDTHKHHRAHLGAGTATQARGRLGMPVTFSIIEFDHDLIRNAGLNVLGGRVRRRKSERPPHRLPRRKRSSSRRTPLASRRRFSSGCNTATPTVTPTSSTKTATTAATNLPIQLTVPVTLVSSITR